MAASNPSTASEPSNALPGQLPTRIGRYEVVEHLGAGGMGSVYKARDPQLQRLVAIKVPHFPPGESGADAVERFLREARIAASLTQAHPHICAVHDVGEHEGKPFVVMAFVDGPSLAAHLRRHRFDDRSAVELVRKVATALAVIHQHGIVHRDVKPGNILLTRAGEPMVTDFGLARPVEDADRLTQSGVVVGTPAYMAPEQARGDWPRPPAEVYSLGVVLYEMLSGHLPFEHPNLRDLLNQVAEGTPSPLSRHRPDVDRRLERIVHKALAREVSDRYGSAEAFAADLSAWLAAPVVARAGLGAILGEASQALSTNDIAPPPKPSETTADAAASTLTSKKPLAPASWRRFSWIAAAFAALTAAFVGLYLLWQSRLPQATPEPPSGLMFASKIDPNGRALDPGTTFSANITNLYAVFRGDTPPPGLEISAKNPRPDAYYSHLIASKDGAPASIGWRWLRDDKIVNEYQTPLAPRDNVWLQRFDRSGIFNGELGPGTYEIVLLLGGQPVMSVKLVINPSS